MHLAAYILFSLLIGLLCIWGLQQLDKYEKEPFGRMVAVAIWGGLWSIIISGELYDLISMAGYHDLRSTLGAMLGIGPVEEISKLLALGSAFPLFRRQLNEPVDGMIYMACVALGFSLIENVCYARLPFCAGERLLIARLIICTPAHIYFSVSMGLAFFVFIHNRRSYGLLLLAIVYASVVHGLFDLIIIRKLGTVPFLVLILFSYRWSLALLSYATAISPFRKTLKAYIHDHGPAEVQPAPPCLFCDDENPKKMVPIGRYPLFRCSACGSYVTSQKGLRQLFRFFANAFINLGKECRTVSEGRQVFKCLVDGNRIDPDRNLAGFELQTLHQVLEKRNRSTIQRMEYRWWFPKQLFDEKKQAADLQSRRLAWRGARMLRRWMVYPFGVEYRRKIHQPPADGPVWNLWALLIPELWYLYHEIWGVFLFIGMLYALGGWLWYQYGWQPLMALLALNIIARVTSGWVGSRIFFYRHGRWPKDPKVT